MGDLETWAKKNSKHLQLADNESLDATYQGYKIGQNSFDPEKEMVFYKLQVLQEGERVSKIFKTASGRVAKFFDTVTVGQRVRITRHGNGSETTYECLLLAPPTAPAPSDDVDDLPIF